MKNPVKREYFQLTKARQKLKIARTLINKKNRQEVMISQRFFIPLPQYNQQNFHDNGNLF